MHSLVSVLCNDPPLKRRPKGEVHRLSYLGERGEKNVQLALPSFVRDVNHIPPRILDLLELAAYVFAADRLVRRGTKNSLEYHAWSRSFDFHVRVRDQAFWNSTAVQEALCNSLAFMSGDRSYHFRFYPGHTTPPTSLFDNESFQIEPPAAGVAVLLFSGGLDSLAGALRILVDTAANACLVSHQSQTGTKRTQDRLAAALREVFPKRTSHYRFECHLSGMRAPEETQRTRSFLYCSIAFAIAFAYRQSKFYVFENGVTSLNFGRRQDLMNARASRTTHPQTIGRMSKLLSLVAERDITIKLPLLWHTKKEVLEELKTGPGAHLISSAVSCSRTFQRLGHATHCGECFQCLDRQFATHATDLTEIDHRGLYALDVLHEPFSTGEGRTTAVDYFRQAMRFARSNPDEFSLEHLHDLSEVIDWLPDRGTELERVEKVDNLCRRHGLAVQEGYQRMRDRHDDPFENLLPGSLLHIIAAREHLKPEVKRLAESIIEIVLNAIPQMFRTHPPDDEPDLNQKIDALLGTHIRALRSEHPTVSFACSKVIPDHMIIGAALLVESKYIRAGTSPAKASEGIAADLTKYPPECHTLFLVLDREHKIQDDSVFKADFESRGRCTICILR